MYKILRIFVIMLAVLFAWLDFSQAAKIVTPTPGSMLKTKKIFFSVNPGFEAQTHYTLSVLEYSNSKQRYILRNAYYYYESVGGDILIPLNGKKLMFVLEWYNKKTKRSGECTATYTAASSWETMYNMYYMPDFNVRFQMLENFRKNVEDVSKFYEDSVRAINIAGCLAKDTVFADFLTTQSSRAFISTEGYKLMLDDFFPDSENYITQLVKELLIESGTIILDCAHNPTEKCLSTPISIIPYAADRLWTTYEWFNHSLVVIQMEDILIEDDVLHKKCKLLDAGKPDIDLDEQINLAIYDRKYSGFNDLRKQKIFNRITDRFDRLSRLYYAFNN